MKQAGIIKTAAQIIGSMRLIYSMVLIYNYCNLAHYIGKFILLMVSRNGNVKKV